MNTRRILLTLLVSIGVFAGIFLHTAWGNTVQTTVTLTATPTSGTAGSVNPVLQWTTSGNVTSCVATGDWSGNKTATGGSESEGVIATAGTRYYTLQCSDDIGNSANASAQVNVTAAGSSALVNINISGTADSNINWHMGPGGYTGTGNSSVTVSSVPAGGQSYTISNLAFAGCATYSVTNSDGSGSSVMVFPSNTKSFAVTYSGCTPPPTNPPTVDLKVNGSDGPIVIAPTGATTQVNFTWNSTNATSCTLNGNPGYPANGSASVGEPDSTNNDSSWGGVGTGTGIITVTMTCNGVGGNASDSVIFAVNSSRPAVDLRAIGNGPGFFQGPISIYPIVGGNCNGLSDPTNPYCLNDTAVSHYEVYPGIQSMILLGANVQHSELVSGCTLSGPGHTFTSSTFDSGNNIPRNPSWPQQGPGFTPFHGTYYDEHQFALGAPTAGYPTGNFSVDFKTTSPQTYTLSCNSPFFPIVNDTVKISFTPRNITDPTTVGSPVGGGGGGPTVSLSASPTTVTGGGSSTLTWTTTGSPTACTASASPANGQWSGSIAPSGGNQTITGINQTTTFSVTCSNSNGSGTDSATVSVNNAAPVVTLTANPTTVSSGQSSVLTWTTANSPLSCSSSAVPANGLWSGSVPVNGGNTTITNISQTTTFKLICNNNFGHASAQVDVNFSPNPQPPIVTISANPTNVTAGASTTVTWSQAINATSCQPGEVWRDNVAGAWNVALVGDDAWMTASKSIAGGSTIVLNLTHKQYVYSLSCHAANGLDVNPNVEVDTTPAPQPATIAVTSNNALGSWTINPGGLNGSGLTGNYSVNPAVGGTTYTIVPSPLANYTVSVAGTRNGTGGFGSSLTLFPADTSNFALTYTGNGPAFTYGLAPSGPISITQGGAGVPETVSISHTGTTQVVNLALSNLPSGVTYSSSNGSCSPDCTATFTFSASSGAPTGQFTITVTGTTAGLANQTTSFVVTVNPAASGLNGTVDTNPPSNPGSGQCFVGQPCALVCTPSGGVPPYTYVWAGTDFPSPSPTTSSVNITYQTVGTKTATCTVTDSSGPPPQSVTSAAKTIQVFLNPNFKEF